MSPPSNSSQDSAGKGSSRPARSGKASASQPSTAAPRPGDGGQPSWPRVIATTLQLWLQRKVLGAEDAAGGRRRSRRRAGASGLAIVVLAAAALTIALAQGRSTPGSRGSAAAGPKIAHPVRLSGAALAVAAANRQQAAVWVAAQVSHSVVVSCDPAMCAALQAHGFPAGDLLALTATANDPMGSGIVMSTTALRNQFGSRLPDIYAPVVIASFGTGATRVDVRVEAPDGSQAYLVSQRADLLARQQSGQQLLHNKNLHVTGASRLDIAAGHVDPRLLLTLAALMDQGYPVYIDRLGDTGPGAAADVPLRMVRIAGRGPAHGKKDAYLHSVLRFLRAQQAPYRASVAVAYVSGRPFVQIEFAAPSPLGLLGARASR